MINDQQNHAVKFLANIAASCENSIEDLTEMSSLFAANPEILSVMTKTTPEYDINTKNILNTISNSLPYVHSAFIYNDNIGMVYSDMGQFDENTFFGTYFKYENYGLSSWKNIFFYRSDPYRIMSPSRLSNDSSDTTPGVIPVVFRRINQIQLENYLIINIDLKELFSAFDDDVTDVYIYNKQTEEIFSARNLSSHNMMFSKELIKTLRYHPNDAFNFRLDTGNALISTHSNNDSLLGYTYFAIIPTSEIIKQELPTIYTYLIVVLISLFIAYIALRSSKKIYAPIRHVKSVLSEHSSIQTSEKGNIFDQLIILAKDLISLR